MNIPDWIEKNRDRFIEISDCIWEYAELGFEEHKSSKILAGFLEAEGFKVTGGIADIPTAFVASHGKGKPVIAILGEYDALPGLSQEALPHQSALEVERAWCRHNLLVLPVWRQPGH
jgi:aminobenzoyl-glutamate utilization protein B